MTILCYHAVEPDWDSPLAVAPSDFSQHCRWLARRRHVLDLSTAMTHLNGSTRLPFGMAALTFDDGFSSIRTHALPILDRYRLPATVFLVAETLTPAGRAVDWVDTPPSWPLETLTVDAVRDMQEHGVKFGSHTWAHFDLTTLDDRECEHDLRTSRELLEDVLGTRVPLLAYPRGIHDERVRRAAARAGYTGAFTLPDAREPTGQYAIPRVGVYRQNGMRALKVKTARWYQPLRMSPMFAKTLRLRTTRKSR